jgi:predicted 3-demethylubiquinone-9 3-methyltransferase (glyoxalase superfamily)
MAQKITPNLWFDTQAEEAAEFYCSVFENSRIISKTLYPEGSGRAGTVVTVEWELDGDRFVGINGGPQFKFDEAISLAISCEDQAEVDYYWDRLTADGGEESMCGWLKDKYGLSWQVVPEGMEEMYSGADPERARRAFEAMQKMRKLDIAALWSAADGVPAP